MASSADPDRRTKVLNDYKRKLLEHREMEAKVKDRTCPLFTLFRQRHGRPREMATLEKREPDSIVNAPQLATKRTTSKIITRLDPIRT